MLSVKVGQYYEFFDPEKESFIIGKAISVDQDVCNYLVYYSCADYFGQKIKSYHSQYELIRSDDQSKEFLVNVKRQVKVLRANEFRKLVNVDRLDTYFFRQKVNGPVLEPELQKMCICATIWSPCDGRKTEECPQCQTAFHLECMRQHSDLRCIECKQELPKSLVYSHLKQQQVEDIRNEVEAPTQKRQKIDESLPQPQQPKEQKLSFPSLPAELSQQLDSYIQEMKNRKTSEVALSISQSERTRQSVRDNFTQALLLGCCEQNPSSTNLKEDEKKCKEIALKIEAAMFIHFQKQISKDYGKKFRVLQTTMQASENLKLRRQLLNGELDPNELTRLSADSLIAPEKLNQKQEEAHKIFNDNVVKPELEVQAMVVKDQGELQYISTEKKIFEEPSQQDDHHTQHQQSQDQLPQQQSLLVTEEKKDMHGMSNDVYEQWVELGQRWSNESLAKRLQERLNEHLVTNQITRESLIQQVNLMQKKYSTTEASAASTM